MFALMNFDFLLCPDTLKKKEYSLCANLGCRYIDDCGDLGTRLNQCTLYEHRGHTLEGYDLKICLCIVLTSVLITSKCQFNSL